mmetsp:Transcript_21000/g.58393  ORF Transcript_21000/g.58393 Transcript_21000/m.58393 type:complete len:436 (+) Transcript_21000:238-1545(+)
MLLLLISLFCLSTALHKVYHTVVVSFPYLGMNREFLFLFHSSHDNFHSVLVEKVNLASVRNGLAQFLQLRNFYFLQEYCQQTLGSVHAKQRILQNLGVDGRQSIVAIVVVAAIAALHILLLPGKIGFVLVGQDSKVSPFVVLTDPLHPRDALRQFRLQHVEAHDHSHDATGDRLFLSLCHEHAVRFTGLLSFLNGVRGELSRRQHDHQGLDGIGGAKMHHVVVIVVVVIVIVVLDVHGFLDALGGTGFEGIDNGIDGGWVDGGSNPIVFPQRITDSFLCPGFPGSAPTGLVGGGNQIGNVNAAKILWFVVVGIVVVVVTERENRVPCRRQGNIFRSSSSSSSNSSSSSSPRDRPLGSGFSLHRSVCIVRAVRSNRSKCMVGRREQCKGQPNRLDRRDRRPRRHCHTDSSGNTDLPLQVLSSTQRTSSIQLLYLKS